MPEGTSLINLGEISKPATVLIEKISDAVGGLFKPYQIRRVSKAEADAEIIRAQAQIEITDIQRRALTRFIGEEAKKQKNMEDITEKAIPELKESSQPQDLDDDWITNFFDKCRIVSDDQMQTLWAKVLAGEANAPGTYSKRTVNFLESLDKQDAELFTLLCRFVWTIVVQDPLVFDVQAMTYNMVGINFDSLTHLDTIGLINFEPLAGYRRPNLPRIVSASYYDLNFSIEFGKDGGNELEIGRVVLTQTGRELAPICGSQRVQGFERYVLDRWSKQSLTINSPDAPINIAQS